MSKQMSLRMDSDELPGIKAIAPLDIPAGRFFAPCSGRDLPLGFELCANQVDLFVFCDLAYHHRDTTAVGAVPADWTLISRHSGRDAMQPPKSTWYTSRPIHASITQEVWRRPDGSEAIVTFRCDLAQDVLVQQFAPASIAVFLHHHDGTGEGGSDLWFLHEPNDQGLDSDHAFLPEVASRLADGAIVVTDGAMADAQFRRHRRFRAAGLEWDPLCVILSTRDRCTVAWRATRIGA